MSLEVCIPIHFVKILIEQWRLHGEKIWQHVQGAEHTYTIALLFSVAKIRYLLAFQWNHQETFGQSLFGHHMKKTILLLLQEIMVLQLGHICLTQDDNLSLDLSCISSSNSHSMRSVNFPAQAESSANHVCIHFSGFLSFSMRGNMPTAYPCIARESPCVNSAFCTFEN